MPHPGPLAQQIPLAGRQQHILRPSRVSRSPGKHPRPAEIIQQRVKSPRRDQTATGHAHDRHELPHGFRRQPPAEIPPS
ncbi:MAG TPA: hypothetical protein VN969_31640 [Streptosporangiaceae bacterium]|nr:hypothetical protein [Streptosporangiaceae bacterium]